MAAPEPVPSARQLDLLERAYRYVLAHGLSDLSLRPLASAIGSSPRVLLYLFGSKDGVVRALLARARADELALLERMREGNGGAGLADAARHIWDWLADPAHRPLLVLWAEAYSRSLTDPDGPWGGFAAATVADWLEVLAGAQREPGGAAAVRERTLLLAVLRGGLLDLLATGEEERVTGAVRAQLAALRAFR